MKQNKKVRIGIVGVGNCASALVQGLTHYAGTKGNEPPSGMMNVQIGGYRVEDIEVATAFDVHAGKVGVDVSEAIGQAPEQHHPLRRAAAVGRASRAGPTLDGIGKYLTGEFEISEARPSTWPRP
jgi:myo-inositol-1-phosphate synthase